MAPIRGTPRPNQRLSNSQKPISKISSMLDDAEKIFNALSTAQNAFNEARKMALGFDSQFEFKLKIVPKNRTTPEKLAITPGKQLTPSSDSKIKLVKRLSQSDDEENKSFACNDCRRRYATEEELKHHVVMKHEHETTRRSSFRQSVSPAKPKTPTTPKSQHSAGKKQFECEYCSKTFIQKYYYDKHIETHLENSSFNSSMDQMYHHQPQNKSQ